MATGGIPQCSVQGRHEEYIDKCTRCERGDKTEEATYYCPTCHQYLCDRCQRLHGEFRENHMVLDSTKKVNWGQRANPEECQVHRGHRITEFCGEHDILCCAVCVSQEHSACENMSDLRQLAIGVLQNQELLSLKDDLKEMQNQMQYVKDVRRQMRQELEISREEFPKRLEDFIKEIQDTLEELKASTISEMNRLYEQHDNDIEADIYVCDEIIRDIDDHREELNTLTGDNNEILLAIKMKTGKEKVLEVKERLRHMITPKPMSLNFTFDATVLEGFQNIKKLGEFMHIPLPPDKIKRATYNTELNIHSEEDTKTCDIQGICQLLDGSLVLSDHKNKNLKRLDNSYKVIDVCPMPKGPNRICCSARKEVAVALAKKVQFVSITDRMRPTVSIGFDHKCHGIACHEKMLYITSQFGGCYVYTLDRTRRQIDYTPVNEVVIASPLSVAVSNNGRHIYIAGSLNELVIADSQGNIEACIKDPNLYNFCRKDVCVDMKGNIIVCNQIGHNVVQFADFGDKSGDIIVEGDEKLVKPEVVCVDNYRKNLIVQRNDTFGGSDTVLVYNISY